MNRYQLSAAALVALAAHAAAQDVGSVRGNVMDREFQEPLPNCTVTIVGTEFKTTTNEQGTFLLSRVPVGTYTVLFTKDGYVQQTARNVAVAAGRLSREIQVSLSGDFTDLEELVVQDVLQLGGGSEQALLQLRFQSPALLDSIGADLMRAAGASDASDAVRLVAGASVQDGKFAVIRGLPDRYVSSQLNGVRLPSADEKTRAVELDQFPSSVIESVRVTKTFLPNQQGDASGGAVDVRLKGIPSESLFFKFSGQQSYNTQVRNRDDFLSYEGGGVSFSGRDASRGPQLDRLGGNWDGAVGVNETTAPIDFKWAMNAGGSYEFSNGLKVGLLANLFFERDSSYYDGGQDNGLWIDSPGEQLTPRTVQGAVLDGDFKTRLFDVTQATQSMQRGGLVVAGAEWEGQKLQYTFLRTRSVSDTATLAVDTRGKEFFFPGYDPDDIASEGNEPTNRNAAPYIRNETLEYTERTVGSQIFQGEHEIPSDDFWIFKAPKFDWTVGLSEADFYQPDKRQFGALWLPRVELPGPTIQEPRWAPFKPAANFSLGNLQRIYKDIREESDLYALNFELPFEQWDGYDGSWKLGWFNDNVERTFDQDTYSNFNDNSGLPDTEFNNPWSDVFASEDHPITESDFDVDYTGEQELEAVYTMLELPLSEQFTVIGGVRWESTSIDVTLDPEPLSFWFPPGATAPVQLNPGDADVDFDSDDALPAVALVYTPTSDITIRAAYSETIARQTFRELTPVLQQEFLGGPIFIGNPELGLARLKNYDLRVDYQPFEKGLFSVSYFYKDIKDPIEFVQRLVGFDFTTAVNLPEGELEGFEFEARQELGLVSDWLEGLSIGGNATIISSEVTLSEEEQARFANPAIDSPRSTRDATNAPEYLLNLNLTYDFETTGTRVGLFYTRTGDTLIAGAGESNGNLVPDVYARSFDRLNVTVAQRLSDYVNLRFQAKNLTDPEIQTEYRPLRANPALRTSQTNGIDLSISIGGEVTF